VTAGCHPTDTDNKKARGGSPFLTRRIVIQPGRAHLYHDAEWHDALIVVEDGRIDLDHQGPRPLGSFHRRGPRPIRDGATQHPQPGPATGRAVRHQPPPPIRRRQKSEERP